ncbi:armadillo-type protein [Thamnocephalis sphaerospora]|uniref:Armadillo-type protein n=1 Tax=Thamnocephalis sphaerospora TaxID=78915 RepID=A0A4P9XVU7_9FUNG|nr:armadillo-type protein [Thamnocephalis sphaerospora]|eukprot:RKP10414.1 armadillo-type protein [Thamnocephalis sphaerospora]
MGTRGTSLSASSTVSSRASNISNSSATTVELPSEQAVLDEMMEQIIESMGLGEAQRQQIRNMPFENKLKLVKSSQFKQLTTEKSGRDASKDRSTPEYYVKKLAESDVKNISLKTWTALRVSLTTQPIGWVRHFIDLRGTQLVWDKLGIVNSRQHRRENDVQVEIEMVKCLKSLLNNKWGTRDALNNEDAIHAILFSLDSPSIVTRRLVAEVLTFICYCDKPHGHALVIRAMDKLQAVRQNKHRFGAWMSVLEQTIEGRGRMGSMVGASDEYRRLGSDRELLEYVLSNIILVNAVVGVCEEVDLRQHYRNQLNSSGLSRILRNVKEFANDLILLQLNKYQREADEDHQELSEFNHAFALPDASSPGDIVETLLKMLEGTKAHDYFLSTLQHMLLVRDDDETRTHYFHLFDKLVTQVVLDRRGMSDDFTHSYGASVKSVIAGFNNEEKLQRMVKDLGAERKKTEELQKRIRELEQQLNLNADDLVTELQERNASMEDLVRMSRTTVEALQGQVNQLRKQYHAKLCEQDKQLQQLYDALKQEADENTQLVNARESLLVENRLMKQLLWPDEGNPTPGQTKTKGVPNITHNMLLREIEKLKQDRGIIWNENNRPRMYSPTSPLGSGEIGPQQATLKRIEQFKPTEVSATFRMENPSPASSARSSVATERRARRKGSSASSYTSLVGSIGKLASLEAEMADFDDDSTSVNSSLADGAHASISPPGSRSGRRSNASPHGSVHGRSELSPTSAMKPLPVPPQNKRQTISFADIKQTQMSSSKPLREALMDSIKQRRVDDSDDDDAMVTTATSLSVTTRRPVVASGLNPLSPVPESPNISTTALKSPHSKATAAGSTGANASAASSMHTGPVSTPSSSRKTSVSMDTSLGDASRMTTSRTSTPSSSRKTSISTDAGIGNDGTLASTGSNTHSISDTSSTTSAINVTATTSTETAGAASTAGDMTANAAVSVHRASIKRSAHLRRGSNNWPRVVTGTGAENANHSANGMSDSDNVIFAPSMDTAVAWAR